MNSLQDIKQLIVDAKNICVIPPQTFEPESLTAALALFYTLRELHKNVNFISDTLPESMNFLVPPLDFISPPKDFIISIPKNIAEVSQVYYEKNEEGLKIHLSVNKGNIKKDNISFYVADAKPDLVITLGIQNFHKELESKLDSFGFLLNAPILNIDNKLENTKFGKINIIEQTSLSEIILSINKELALSGTNKNLANCLLAGLIVYYDNFQKPTISPEVFALSANLMKQGANRQQILENLHQSPKPDLHFPTEKPLHVVTS